MALEPARACGAVAFANVGPDRISRTQWSGVIKPDHCRGYPSEASSNRTPSRCDVERIWRCPDTTTVALKRRYQSSVRRVPHQIEKRGIRGSFARSARNGK